MIVCQMLVKLKDSRRNSLTIDLCDPSDQDQSELRLNSLSLNDSSGATAVEPKLPPVNSFHRKLDAKPEFKPSFLDEVNQRYSSKKLSHQERIEQASQIVQEQQAAAQKQERLFNKRLIGEWFTPDLPIVVLDDEPESVDDYNDFPQFSAEQSAFIEQKLRPRPDQEALITKFSITIRRGDIQTLAGLNWLNDEIINFYMNLLTERSTERADAGYPKVYAFSTFFLPRLTASGHAGVRRWTRKVDVFAYDIIPVPVHVGGVHWCMAIIDFRDKSIRYYDSMLSKNPTVLNTLSDYLVDESRDKKGVPYDMSGWVCESLTNIPRQNNQSDCGVFSCAFAETITRNRPIKFSQQNMPYMRLKMVLEICQGQLIL